MDFDAYIIDVRAVALVATASSILGKDIQVQLDEGDARAKSVFCILDTTDGQQQLVAIVDVTASTTIGVRHRGVSISKPLALDSTPEMPPLRLAAVLNSVDRDIHRLRLLRMITQDCATFLGLAGLPGYDRLRAEAVSELRHQSQPGIIEKAIRLSPGLGLLIFQETPLAGTELIQCTKDAHTRYSPTKPLRLSRSRPDGNGIPQFALFIEATSEHLSQGEVFLWKADASVIHVDLGEMAARDQSALLPLVNELGDDGLLVTSYLAAALAAHTAAQPELARALKEISLLATPRATKNFFSDRPVGIGIDIALGTENDGVVFSGWAFDPDGLIEKVRWIGPMNERVSISDHWAKSAPNTLPERYCVDGRGDQAFGFVGRIDVGRVAAAIPQHRFEVVLASGATAELVAPPVPFTAVEARNTVLSAVTDDDIMDDAVWTALSPAISAFHKAHLAGPRVTKDKSFGIAPPAPTHSIIIPVFKALEFIRFQFGAFSVDPDFSNAELIYVLDSPEQVEEVEMRLSAMERLYRLPVRLIVHEKNLGYAPAVNTGASLARAKSIVMLNSDIVPARPGWIRTMSRRLNGDVGAVGPKLLFHDDSIQHAGMDFGLDLKGRRFNRHPYKGYPRAFPAANIAGPVPALTGACILMKKQLFLDLGGVCEDYVIGDFEDSDFCLRLRDKGKTLFFEPTAELYHYERQSIGQNDDYTGTRAGTYNRKLHGVRWDNSHHFRTAP